MSRRLELGANDTRRPAPSTGRAENTNLRQMKWDTVSLHFDPKSLKTNDGRPNEVGHSCKYRQRAKSALDHSQITIHQSLRNLNG